MKPKLSIHDILAMNDMEMAMMKDDEFELAVGQVLSFYEQHRKTSALSTYAPNSARCLEIHRRTERYVGVGGGNGSGKTETCLVDLLIQATGIIPYSLRDEQAIWDKQRGPINARFVCESITTTLYNTILPKLQFFKWTGIDAPGGERGHWGWVPRTSLIDGAWDRSWSEKTRTLRILYRDPNDPDRVRGESTLQFMSHDQDSTDFASGDYHATLLDEPPNFAIWRETEARSMRVNGRIYLAMTWPDDPAINVAWLFDEMYEPGQEGTARDPAKIWLNLYTTENVHLDQVAIADQARIWSPEMTAVRHYGQPIRFSNRIHPDYTDQTHWWCFACGKRTIETKQTCASCASDRITPYKHFTPFGPESGWPTVFLLDPHPRKAHCMSWVQVDAADDLWQVAELEVDAPAEEVAEQVFALEKRLRLDIALRLIDPNMGRSPAAASRNRETSWIDEFDAVGLRCDEADDSDVGRSRLDAYLKPDPNLLRPRLHVAESCTRTNYQMKRYIWDDYKKSVDKDPKQTPKPRNDDFPTLLRYLMNWGPEFRRLRLGSPVMQRRTRTHTPGERYPRTRGVRAA